MKKSSTPVTGFNVYLELFLLLRQIFEKPKRMPVQGTECQFSCQAETVIRKQSMQWWENMVNESIVREVHSEIATIPQDC